jgi:exonuclease III
MAGDWASWTAKGLLIPTSLRGVGLLANRQSDHFDVRAHFLEIDAFRVFCAETGHYTWWSPIKGVRERNIGWRLDYILVDDRLAGSLETCFHSPEQFGSDHCPVTVVFNAAS